MSWRYSQSSGDLERLDDAGFVMLTIVQAAYSGHGEGLNNPALDHVASVGPIPRGRWAIGAPRDSNNVGPYALPLEPIDAMGNLALRPDVAHGRSGFLIHGDNLHRNRSASHGCIVMARRIRELIADSSDNVLEVVA